MRTIIQVIASTVDAYKRNIERGDADWKLLNGATLAQIQRDLLPSGSGIDSGTRIDTDASTADKVILTTSFHHMSEAGHYDGWTEHRITVRPSFQGLSLTISGRDRNDIKDYLRQTFLECLLTEIVFRDGAYRPSSR